MTETVSHTFKRELDHVDDRDTMDALSRVINGSVDNSVYVCLTLTLVSTVLWHPVYGLCCRQAVVFFQCLVGHSGPM